MKKQFNYKLAKTAVIGGIIMLALLVVDLVSKAWAEANWVRSNLFLGLVGLNFTRNAGIAFGILSDNPVAMYGVTAVTLLMIAGIGVLFFTLFKKNVPAQICLAVIEAGAIGNLIDRLCLVNDFGTHYVRDFIDLTRIGFGICNIADFCITLGAVALVFIIFFIGRSAVFPLTQKWRKEAKKDDKAKSHKKAKR